jgi:hypothetical protein
MADLTVEELRKRVETSAEDAVLASLITAAYQAIVLRIGPAGETSELLDASGDRLMLSSPAASVTRITARGRELETDDYELRPGGQFLLRANHRPWGHDVDVTYVRLDDEASRKRAAAALVALELDFRPGVTSQRIGEWSETYSSGQGGGYAEDHEAILSSLESSFVLL